MDGLSDSLLEKAVGRGATISLPRASIGRGSGDLNGGGYLNGYLVAHPT